MADNSASQADDGSPADASPWNAGLDYADADPIHKQALIGYAKGVSSGVIDKDDGLQRLKKFGSVHPSATVQDVLPQANQLAARAAAQPAPDQRNGSQFQGGPSTTLRNITNPSGSAPNTPSMNQTGMSPPPQSSFGTGDTAENVGPPTFSNWLKMQQPMPADQASVNRAKYGRELPQDSVGAMGGLMNMHTTKNEEDQTSSDSSQAKTVTQGKYSDFAGDAGRLASAMGYTMTPQTETDAKGRIVPKFDPVTNQPLYSQSATPDPNNPYQQQKSGLDRMQALLQMDAKTQAGISPFARVDYRPLLALANASARPQDRVSMEGLAPPESAGTAKDKLLAYQQQLMQDRAKMNQELTSSVKANQPMLGYQNMLGSNQGYVDKNINSDQSGLSPQAMRLIQQEVRDNQQDWQKAQSVHQNNMNALKKDPNAMKMVAGVNSLNNVFDNFTKNPSPQSYNGLQQAIRLAESNLSPGAKTGVEERMENYTPSVEKFLLNLKQKFGNNVQQIPPNDPQVLQLKQETANFQQELQKEIMQEAVNMTGGEKYIYDDPRFGQLLTQSRDELLRNYGAQKGSHTQVPSQGSPTPGVSQFRKPAPKQTGGTQTFPVGSTRVNPKDGKTYKKAADGMWDLVQ